MSVGIVHDIQNDEIHVDKQRDRVSVFTPGSTETWSVSTLFTFYLSAKIRSLSFSIEVGSNVSGLEPILNDHVPQSTTP